MDGLSPDDSQNTGQGRGALVRLILAGGLTLYAMLTLLSGLDRMQLNYEKLPRITHWPYAMGSLVRRASDNLTAGTATAALPVARDLVRSDPIDPDALGLLGFALKQTGQAARARDAYAMSARLGWRNQAAQVYWLYAGLQQGDAKLASLHLDALLRRTENQPNSDRWINDLLAYDEGRAALADRLREDPQWGKRFISEVEQLDADGLAARADVVARTGKGHFDCKAGARLVNALLKAELTTEANTAHQTMCGQSDGVLYDGKFDQLDLSTAGSELDWNVTQRGDTVVAAIPSGNGHHSVTMTVNGPTTVMMLRQTVFAAPGAYRLSWHAPTIPATDVASLQVSFDCQWDLSTARRGILRNSTSNLYTADFIVPQGCAAPMIHFWLSPNHLVTITNLAMHAIAPGTVDDQTLAPEAD